MVCISIFDLVANLLHEKLVLLHGEPKVMIATNIYPKLVGGEYNRLSSASFNYVEFSVKILAYCLIPGRLFLKAISDYAII